MDTFTLRRVLSFYGSGARRLLGAGFPASGNGRAAFRARTEFAARIARRHPAYSPDRPREPEPGSRRLAASGAQALALVPGVVK